MSVFKDLYVKRNLTVTGDLNVTGTTTTTSVDSQNVLLADNFMVLNGKATDVASFSGGVVINHESLVKSDVASSVATNVITVGVDFTSNLSTGVGFILVKGSAENDGIYETSAADATTVTINTSPTSGFANTSIADATETFSVAVIKVHVLRSNAAGVLEAGTVSKASDIAADIKTVLRSGDAASSITIAATADIDQILLGTTGIATISAVNTSNATYTIPEIGAGPDTFVFTDFAQTLTNKTFVAPVLGTPASGTLTNCTGLLISGISNLGPDVGTFLAAPTSANLATAVSSSSTGSGSLVFGTSPTLTTPVISSIVNGAATLTLPLTTDFLVGKNTFDILTNKTLTLPKINDTSSDHTYNFLVSELTATRTITLPLLLSDDTFVFEAFEQTLTNKTLDAPIFSTPHVSTVSASVETTSLAIVDPITRFSTVGTALAPTLPLSADSQGKMYIIYLAVAGNPLTITRSGTDTIGNGTDISIELNTQHQIVKLLCVGSVWTVV